MTEPTLKREPGNFDLYEQRGDDWFCKTCGGVIMAIEQICSVWDGPFPMSGSGRTVRQQAPYCPKCENEPPWRGQPIVPGRNN